MEIYITYILLFAIIVVVGNAFRNFTLPISLLLVITGMLLSFVPKFPRINLNPDVILNIFLPLLIYQISGFSSWKDVKKNLRPIALLSVGHVIFITVLVAVVIHALIPELGWPLAFVLGAVISPPDDVAIVSIAEKIHMPSRIVTILEGEGMFNDATALILFRFALAAALTHHFYVMHAGEAFVAVIVGETLYGLAVGFVMGEIRRRIPNSSLHMIASILTPFIAYVPAVMLGGCGVLATAVSGFVIGNVYALRFSPEFRLVSRSIWPTLSFGIQSILFLLIGLDLRLIIENISSIAIGSLLLYGLAVIAVVIIGRFIWVYLAAILPRILFPGILKKDPYPSWQSLFIISWAGMRGGVSLAAALAVPVLPLAVQGANSRDLLIFLVFCVITATLLLQGLSLPWLLKVMGIQKHAQREKYDEHLAELTAKLKMAAAALKWLKEYREKTEDAELLELIKLNIERYKMQKIKLDAIIKNHDSEILHDDHLDRNEENCLLTQLIEIEKAKLLHLWQNEKINLVVRDKLLEQLDHRSKHIS